ncbi:unnamed protein product [Prunus armeniaca]
MAPKCSQTTKVSTTTPSWMSEEEATKHASEFQAVLVQAQSASSVRLYSPLPLMLRGPYRTLLLGPHYTCLIRAPFSYGLEDIDWRSWDAHLEWLGSNPVIPFPEDFLPWADWVDAMFDLFKDKWMLNGIFQAIMLSKHQIALNPSLIGHGPMTPIVLDMAAFFGFRPHGLSIDAQEDYDMKNRKVGVPIRAYASEIMHLKAYLGFVMTYQAEALHNESDLATAPFMLALLYHCLHQISINPFNLDVCGPIWMLQIWLEWYFPELGSMGSESLEDNASAEDAPANALATRPRRLFGLVQAVLELLYSSVNKGSSWGNLSMIPQEIRLVRALRQSRIEKVRVPPSDPSPLCTPSFYEFWQDRLSSWLPEPAKLLYTSTFQNCPFAQLETAVDEPRDPELNARGVVPADDET